MIEEDLSHNFFCKVCCIKRYLGVTVTNTNDIRGEIKRRINMGNACYYSLEKILSSRLLSKKLKVKQYKTIILPVVLYGCETWSLTLREERRLRVLENKVLRKIFGAKKDEITGEWRKLHNAELHALYSSSNIIRNLKIETTEMERIITNKKISTIENLKVELAAAWRQLRQSNYCARLVQSMPNRV